MLRITSGNSTASAHAAQFRRKLYCTVRCFTALAKAPELRDMPKSISRDCAAARNLAKRGGILCSIGGFRAGFAGATQLRLMLRASAAVSQLAMMLCWHRPVLRIRGRCCAEPVGALQQANHPSPQPRMLHSLSLLLVAPSSGRIRAATSEELATAAASTGAFPARWGRNDVIVRRFGIE